MLTYRSTETYKNCNRNIFIDITNTIMFVFEFHNHLPFKITVLKQNVSKLIFRGRPPNFVDTYYSLPYWELCEYFIEY